MAGWTRLLLTVAESERRFFRRHPRAEGPACMATLAMLVAGAVAAAWVLP